MNKRLLIGMFSAFMAVTPLTGYAAQTIDSPHLDLGNNGPTENCLYCHNQPELAPNTCESCHVAQTGPYGTLPDNTSPGPLATTHQGITCAACHNPHVSRQTAGTISGTFTGVSYDAGTGMTTLSGLSVVPETSWAMKNGSDPARGMILWVNDGAEKASYEVKGIDATAGTVTVKGDVPIAAIGSFDLRRGQLIAKKVSKDATKSYAKADAANLATVEYPSQGSSSIFIDTVNGASPTGVCQVCHTLTQYWKNDGTGTAHNADRLCTDCHKHSSAFLVTGCTACHTGADPDGAPRTLAELASPSTGSQTPGMHAIHATATGYNFPCATCHVGTGMDRVNDPTNPVKGDGIQIGFNVANKYLGYLTSYNGQASVTVPYEGTNHTTVTNTGAVGSGNLTCSNVYCHSDGTAVRRNCATSMPNTSPAWDGSSADPQGDTVKCNNCHGYMKNIANTMTSGRHGSHVSTYGMSCETCHADTAASDGAGGSMIANKANHVNGSYDIKGSGTYAGNPIVVTYDKTTRSCSVATCHPARTWTPSDTGTCPNACTGDALVNVDPIINFTTASVDDRTLKLIDTSVDPDSIDAVKNVCQGGGFNGSPGYIKVTTSDPKLGNVIVLTTLQGASTPATSIRSYPDSQIDLVTDPNAPRLWFTYKVADNGPLTTTNMGNGTKTATDGFVDSGWTAHVLSPVDMATVNAMPYINYTVAATNNGNGTYTITFTDQTIDPDANDPAKTALFGGGHDGSLGRGKLLFNDGSSINNNNIPFGTTPSNTTFTKVVTGTAGQQVWYSYTVWDNHFRNAAAQAASPTTSIEMGWKFIVLP